MGTLVTLTTNFGARDPSAAALKGVLYRLCPGITLVDLSHELPPDDLMDSALFMAAALPYFPAGTIHLVNINPGPTPIVVSIAEQYVVCPDNGVLTVLADAHPIEAIHAIKPPERTAGSSGQIFYGREIFAPAIAQLVQCAAPASLGGPLDEIVRLDLPRPKQETDQWIKGEVIHVDAFGNLVTNIHRSLLEGIPLAKIVIEGFWLDRLSGSYGDVPVGSPVALYQAGGYLQIAYRADRADKRLRAGKGSLVKVVIA
jgi:S-adenosylmethionine hydrolase